MRKALTLSLHLQLREYAVPSEFPSEAPLPALPASLPDSFRGLRVIRAIRQEHTTLLVFGRDFASGRYLVAADPKTGTLRYGFDFVNYTYAPYTSPGDREFVYQEPVWAAEAGGVLYVENAHDTYAR